MPNMNTKLNSKKIILSQTNSNLNSGIQNLKENEFGEFCVSGINEGKNEINPAILKFFAQISIVGYLGQLSNPSGFCINI